MTGCKKDVCVLLLENIGFESHRRRDQMATLVVQYLAFYNNENLPNRLKICIMLNEPSKNNQIWSHCLPPALSSLDLGYANKRCHGVRKDGQIERREMMLLIATYIAKEILIINT